MLKLTATQWIVDGYGTMMSEIDDQLGEEQATHFFAPVGVGSFAQAVTSHFRRESRSTRVIGVEPDTAACLWKSLSGGASTTIETVPTIMAGLDCGTVSTTAWPILSKGLCASVTVSDFEAHSASLYLGSCSVSAGPYSGSTVAALRRLSPADRNRLGIDSSSVIVLLCTDGARDHGLPLDVATDDPVELTQLLVQINSANPNMGSIPGPGETAIACYIAAWLEHRDLEAHWIEPTHGRPSIVGVMRGTGGGRSLMFNGHIDTVTLVGYDKDPLSGTIENGKLYGRGAADMKCGVAAAMVALANSKHLRLCGDVIFAGVADEEDLSIGTKDVLGAGWRADGAIVNEPTDLCVVNAHKGFVWLEVKIHGVASHGSRADLGVDAISRAGRFLSELDRHAQCLRTSRPDSLVGPPTIHASLIKGGEEVSSYPASCLVTLERRTLIGETASSVEDEIRDLLEKVQQQVENFEFDVRATASRPAFESDGDNEFCRLDCEEAGAAMDTTPTIKGEPYWTDCALLAAEGIPSLLWGPIGGGLHAKKEWVDVESIRTVSSALTSIAGKFCK
jgi:acetylornithine deacetylase/succinyl-diaminopimelate desuccinylase-like protein